MGHLLCLGLNHTTAPLVLRERLAFAPTPLREALAKLNHSDDQSLPAIAEAAIVSTCNRLEVYALTGDPALAADGIIEFLSAERDVPQEAFRDALYQKIDADAVRHLMNVASGLDSLVLGEPQILGQVADAYEVARGQGAVGPVLSALFQAAIHAGKRSRSETRISTKSASISSVAVRLASEMFGSIDNCEVLVVGAGEMGELAVHALMKRGARGLLVANRTYDRAVQLARTWGGEAMTFERLAEGLARADIVITATDAPHAVLYERELQIVMRERQQRPIIIMDIAVPRDVEVGVGDMDNVSLYNIDDLQDIVETNIKGRRAEVSNVEVIVQEELDDFMDWFAALDVVPTINDLRRHVEAIRDAEVERALHKLGDLSDAEREVIENLSTRLVNKVLHDPITRLKKEAANGNGAIYTQATRYLFGLEE